VSSLKRNFISDYLSIILDKERRISIMKKMIYYLTLAVVLIMLAGAGCSNKQGEPGLEPGAEPISGSVYSIVNLQLLPYGSREN